MEKRSPRPGPGLPALQGHAGARRSRSSPAKILQLISCWEVLAAPTRQENKTSGAGCCQHPERDGRGGLGLGRLPGDRGEHAAPRTRSSSAAFLRTSIFLTK